jgi:hypothetical protein
VVIKSALLSTRDHSLPGREMALYHLKTCAGAVLGINS